MANRRIARNYSDVDRPVVLRFCIQLFLMLIHLVRPHGIVSNALNQPKIAPTWICC